MKYLVQFIRVFVGVLFIFSGLVKANDPMGLSYKMQEFFEIWGLHGFNTWTLPLSVLMNAFEIIAGVALLLGWRIRIIIWLLLLLIVFFTFLTGYTYITGEPKNCGCFGDCIPISSRTSFLKDVVLAILIGILLWKQKIISPLLQEKWVIGIMAVTAVFSFAFQWYTLTYLPFMDCLPFKKGNNIQEQMKMPRNAIPDSTVISFVYEKNGQLITFTANQFPPDFNSTDYKFVSRQDQLIRKGRNNEPPLKGFVLTGVSNEDSTSVVLEQAKSVLLFIEHFSKAGNSWKKNFAPIFEAAQKKNIPVYLITAEPGNAAAEIAGTVFSSVQVFKCDYKVIETAARTPACVYILQKGTVLGKWSSPRFTAAARFIHKMN